MRNKQKKYLTSLQYVALTLVIIALVAGQLLAFRQYKISLPSSSFEIQEAELNGGNPHAFTATMLENMTSGINRMMLYNTILLWLVLIGIFVILFSRK